MIKFEPEKEREFLNTLVSDYKDQAVYSEIKKDIIFDVIGEYTENEKNKNVLQLGCSNGYETNRLSDKFLMVDIIDGSSEFIDRLSKINKSKNLNFICNLFEEYSMKQGQSGYDYIFCNYVLEHVFDSVAVLKNIGETLSTDGIIFAVVPNAMAFSRQLAKKMGMLNNLKSLTENDKIHGHRRVYDVDDIRKDFIESGFEIVDVRGIIFKILADFQLNKMMEQNIIEKSHVYALQEMAGNMTDFCDSILVVARKIKD